ncbi:MAG: MCE family protein [Planctomycetes bacterium]|nr:MCE family protein [Planctomycetota bacterium]
MDDRSRNFWVGVFMLGTLGALAALTVLFGERPSWLGGAEWELRISFTEVEGVSEGMEITMNGVQIGRVGSVEFTNPELPQMGVQVIGLIKERYSIPEGTKAKVYAGPLGIGRGRIELVVETLDERMLPKDNAFIIGEMGSPFEDLVPDSLMFTLEKTARQIGDLAAEAKPLAGALHHFFEIRTVEQVDGDLGEIRSITANMYTVVQRFDKTLKHFNDVLGDPEVKSAFKEAIENLRQMTEDGRAALATIRDTATQVQQDLDRLADRLDRGLTDAHAGINEIRERLVPALDSLAEMAVNLNKATLSLAEGQGTMGMMLHDPRLYEALVLTAERVTDAVDKIRRLLDRWEKQGYMEFQAHKAIGPLPYKGREPIPE